MMVENAIKERRSIRKYTSKKVSDEQIHKILEAGFYAPTARNLCPTHFVVIKEKVKLEMISSEQQNAAFCKDAALGILVCGDRTVDIDGYIIENASAAIQNMLLTIHDLGLGGVWCAVYPRDERVESFKKICNLPDSILPVGFVVVGYADEEKPVLDRFNEEFVHNEEW